MDGETLDPAAAHKRQYEYTYRLPTPPRVSVPPPPALRTSRDAIVRRLQVRDVSFDASEEDGIDASFLKEFNLTEGLQVNPIMNWKYTQRREAQKILPWLCLGPVNAAKDGAYLLREGITMTLAVRIHLNAMNAAIQAGRNVCSDVATIEIPDSRALIQSFPRATKMINRHMAEIRRTAPPTSNSRGHGRVLVFCESGNDYSAAVVAAYMMEVFEDLDHIQAMALCQERRFCVFFTDNVKNILKSYWDILQAKRTVSCSRLGFSRSPPSCHQPGQQPTSAAHGKRSIRDTMDDEDVDMEDGMDPDDNLRFAGRSMMPFSDG